MRARAQTKAGCLTNGHRMTSDNFVLVSWVSVGAATKCWRLRAVGTRGARGPRGPGGAKGSVGARESSRPSHDQWQFHACFLSECWRRYQMLKTQGLLTLGSQGAKGPGGQGAREPGNQRGQGGHWSPLAPIETILYLFPEWIWCQCITLPNVEGAGPVEPGRAKRYQRSHGNQEDKEGQGIRRTRSSRRVRRVRSARSARRAKRARIEGKEGQEVQESQGYQGGHQSHLR